MRIGLRTYVDGWGVESRTEITYALGGQYALLHADLGIDEEAGDGGSVEFIVELDGQPAYRSGVVTGAMPPRRIHVNLSGARTMRLIVDFDGQAHVLDHADWGEPVLVTKPP